MAEMGERAVVPQRLLMTPRTAVLLLVVGVLVGCSPRSSSGDPEAGLGSSVPETVESPAATAPPRTLIDGSPGPSDDQLEHYDFMIGCLAERGIPAEYDPEIGGLQIGVGLSQEEALDEALEACREADGQPIGVVTDDYLREYYPFLVQLHACLVEEGLPVPELISAESFVDGGGEWHPYQVMWAATEANRTGSSDELRTAEALCPNDADAPQW